MFRHGSMLDPKLVRDISAWDEDPGALRKGLDQLKDPKFSVQPGTPGFKKEQLPGVLLTFKHSGKLSATLTAASSCTSAISAEESLTLTVEGLTAASVLDERIIDWIEPGKGAWVPNLERRGLNWSTKCMKEELFVVGEDGLVESIPLLTPSEAELDEIEATELQHA